MKILDISFKTLRDAVCRQWKTILVFVLCFGAAGAVFGCILSRTGDITGRGSAEAMEYVDYNKIEFDRDYYARCTLTLAAAYDDAKEYLKVLHNDRTATEAQKEQIRLIQDELDGLEYNIAEIKEQYLDVNTALCPAEFAADAADYNDRKRKEYEQGLEEAKKSLALVSEAAGEEETAQALEPILSEALALAQYQKAVSIFENRLEWLHEHSDDMEEQNAAARRELAAAADELNQIIKKANGAAEKLADENHLIIKLFYADIDRTDYQIVPDGLDDLDKTEEEKKPFEAGIEHSFSISRAEDAFAVLTLLFLLTGVCTGVFFAVCREASASDKRAAVQHGEKLEKE